MFGLKLYKQKIRHDSTDELYKDMLVQTQQNFDWAETDEDKLRAIEDMRYAEAAYAGYIFAKEAMRHKSSFEQKMFENLFQAAKPTA